MASRRRFARRPHEGIAPALSRRCSINSRRSNVEGLESLRAKLLGLSGVPIDAEHVLQLLAEVVSAGGGVHVEVDDATRFKLIRRDGKFVLTKDAMRSRPSSMPPRR
jgi:hypothetical protein